MPYTAKDYDRALIAPEQIFASPMDIVTTESMTAEQKLEVLRRWEVNAKDLQVASEENMTGPAEITRLGEVKQAILRLQEMESGAQR